MQDTLLINSLVSFIYISILSLSTYQIGHLVLYRTPIEDHKVGFLFKIGIGLIILSTLLFVCVHAQIISPVSIWTIFSLLVLFSLFSLKKILMSFHFYETYFRWAPIAFYFIFAFFMCNLPAAIRDELVYHLQVPRQLLENGGFFTFKNNVYAYFPQFADMFFVLGLGVWGEMAAKAFHWLCGILCSAALYIFIKNEFSKEEAWWSTLIWISTPSFFIILSWAYVDLAFCFFFLLAFISTHYFLKDQKVIWCIFSGIFLGATAAIKYTGIQMTILFLIVIFLTQWKNKEKKVFKPVLYIVLFSILFASPYLIRNYLITGWPLFPFQIFAVPLHEGINWDIQRTNYFISWLRMFGTQFTGETFWDFFLAPINVFISGKFNDSVNYEGILGPVFLLVIPFTLFKEWRSKINFFMVLLVLFFLYYWTSTTRQVRFLLPIIPVLAFFVARGITLTKKVWVKLLLFLLILFNFYQGFVQAFTYDPVSFWLGKKTKEEFLRKQNSVYPIYSATNQLLNENEKVYLIYMKNYGYYLNCQWESDYVFESYRLDKLLNDENIKVEDIERFFRNMNITHLMINHKILTSLHYGLSKQKQILFFRFLRENTDPILRDPDHSLYKLKEHAQ